MGTKLDLTMTKAIINIILTLEYSGDEVINEDTAVSLLEDITVVLGDLDNKNKIRLQVILNELIKEYSDKERDTIYQFFRNIV